MAETFSQRGRQQVDLFSSSAKNDSYFSGNDPVATLKAKKSPVAGTAELIYSAEGKISKIYLYEIVTDEKGSKKNVLVKSFGTGKKEKKQKDPSGTIPVDGEVGTHKYFLKVVDGQGRVARTEPIEVEFKGVGVNLGNIDFSSPFGTAKEFKKHGKGGGMQFNASRIGASGFYRDYNDNVQGHDSIYSSSVNRHSYVFGTSFGFNSRDEDKSYYLSIMRGESYTKGTVSPLESGKPASEINYSLGVTMAEATFDIVTFRTKNGVPIHAKISLMGGVEDSGAPVFSVTIDTPILAVRAGSGAVSFGIYGTIPFSPSMLGQRIYSDPFGEGGLGAKLKVYTRFINFVGTFGGTGIEFRSDYEKDHRENTLVAGGSIEAKPWKKLKIGAGATISASSAGDINTSSGMLGTYYGFSLKYNIP